MTSPAEVTPPPSRLVATALIVVLAGGAMLATWRQIGQTYTWAEEAEARRLAALAASSPDSQDLLTPATTAVPPRSPWRTWLSRWAISVDEGFTVLQAGLLGGGAGLGWLAFRRGTRGMPSGRRSHRPGPGRLAAAVSVGVLALATLVALRSTWIDPRLDGSGARADPGEPSRSWTVLATTGGEWLPTTLAAAWIALAASGQWQRRADDPIERLGRRLGWLWFGLTLIKVGLAIRDLIAPASPS